MPGEPNNARNSEDCVEMYSFDGSGKWNDQGCDDLLDFICELTGKN